MARIWTEQYDPQRHQNRMGWEVGEPTSGAQHSRAPSLDRSRVLFVRVCSFTFEFHSRPQLDACLAFYAQKLHPSTRQPGPFFGHGMSDHRESERWFERLPLYLREEPKRVQVVAALERAVTLAEGERFV